MRLILREGVSFEVADKNTTLPIITEIWHDHVYGDLRELSGASAPTIIDIGGNIGVFSIFALSHIPGARVFAFEPEPRNFACLQKNIDSNHLAERAVLVNKAICGTRGERLLFLTGANSGTNTLFETEHYISKIAVPCITLEDILNEYTIATCDLLKIDCEGAEYEILMDTPASVFPHIKRIMLEWHAVAGRDPEALASFLESVGYVVTLNDPVAHVMTAVQR